MVLARRYRAGPRCAQKLAYTVVAVTAQSSMVVAVAAVHMAVCHFFF